MIVAFDIETVPLREYWDADEATIEALTASHGAPPGLHPLTSHVVSFACAIKENRNVACWPEAVAAHEVTVLDEAFRILAWAKAKDARLVTFNGKGFDLPMLRLRAALLERPVPALPWRNWLYPFDDRQHCDLRLVCGNGDRRAKGSQELWALGFGVPAISRGHEVLDMVRRGAFYEVAAYNQDDVETLVGLYGKLERVL